MKKLFFLVFLTISTSHFLYSQQHVLEFGTSSQVRNSIIFNNPDGAPIPLGVSVTFSASDSVLPNGGDNLHLPVSPFNNNGNGFRINSGSLVFERGNRLYLGASDTLDLDYNSRVSGASLDMGAFEYPIRHTRIEGQSGDTTVCEGKSVLFNVEVYGEPNFMSFQWQHNGENLNGQTSSTLEIRDVSISDTGYYRLLVFGICCNDTSAWIRLDVDRMPMLVAMNDTAIVSGENITLRVVESVGDVVWYASDMETVVSELLIENITEPMQFFAVATSGVCADTVVIDPVFILISGLPCRVSHFGDTTICSGDPFQLLIDEATVTARWAFLGSTAHILPGEIIHPDRDTTLVLLGLDVDGNVCYADTLVITVFETELNVRPDAFICENESILLWSIPPADEWFNADNNPLGSSGDIIINNSPAGQTTYTAQRMDPNTRCIVRKEVSVTVNPSDLSLPFGELVSRGQYHLTMCEGDHVHLRTNIEDPNLVMWERLSDGEMLPGDTTITAFTSDIFRAHLPDEVCGTIHVDLTLIIQPLPEFEILEQDPICEGTSVHLTSIPNASRWYSLDGTRVFMP
ncbi:MAG: immunoglobulin domain-containing protein, partial [Bacteroidales bacterium]|nr:immunoglobulin domain-containing protein [Bacteroidales bacterium]